MKIAIDFYRRICYTGGEDERETKGDKMKVDTAEIWGNKIFIEVDGIHFDSDDYKTVKETIQAVINYVEKVKGGTQ